MVFLCMFNKLIKVEYFILVIFRFKRDVGLLCFSSFCFWLVKEIIIDVEKLLIDCYLFFLKFLNLEV